MSLQDKTRRKPTPIIRITQRSVDKDRETAQGCGYPKKPFFIYTVLEKENSIDITTEYGIGTNKITKKQF